MKSCRLGSVSAKGGWRNIRIVSDAGERLEINSDSQSSGYSKRKDQLEIMHVARRCLKNMRYYTLTFSTKSRDR